MKSHDERLAARMWGFLCFGALLILCALGVRCDDLVYGGRGTAGLAMGGGTVWPCNPRCKEFGESGVLPDPGDVGCYQSAAVAYLRGEVLAGRLRYAASRPYASQEEAAGYLGYPPIMWMRCPHYGTWSIGTTTWQGCAAGVSYGTSILVSLADQARVLPLVAWETANANVTWILGRTDLGDGAEVGAATKYATQVCEALRLPLIAMP